MVTSWEEVVVIGLVVNPGLVVPVGFVVSPVNKLDNVLTIVEKVLLSVVGDFVVVPASQSQYNSML